MEKKRIYMVKPFPLADLNRAILDAFSLANLRC